MHRPSSTGHVERIDIKPILIQASEELAKRDDILEPVAHSIAYSTVNYLYEKASGNPEVLSFLKPYLIALDERVGSGGSSVDGPKIEDPALGA